MIKGDVTISGLLAVQGIQMTVLTTIYPSDRRLKRDLVPVSDSLSKLSKLKGVYYNWMKDITYDKSTLYLDDKRHIGLLAQDVQQVLPEIVSEIANGKYLGINYQELIPVVIEAINEMNDEKYIQNNYNCNNKILNNETNLKIENLENQIITLIDEMKSLKERLQKIELKLNS